MCVKNNMSCDGIDGLMTLRALSDNKYKRKRKYEGTGKQG